MILEEIDLVNIHRAKLVISKDSALIYVLDFTQKSFVSVKMIFLPMTYDISRHFRIALAI